MSPDIKGVITGLLATNNYKNKGESYSSLLFSRR